jgi:hypothetical protein
MNPKQLLKTTGHAIDKNSPTILTAIGATGVISTTALGIKATLSAKTLVDEELDPNSTQKEIIEAVWMLYIPTVISGVITIASIIGSNHISSQRNAALASLYSITNSALNEYQDKVVELVGEKKATKVKDEIAQDKLNSNPVEKTEVFLTGKGEHLCYDSLSGRYFKSDIETIRKAINDFNAELWKDMYHTLNEFYDYLDLEHTEMGRTSGWNVEDGMLEVHFSANIATSGEPCIVLEYLTTPKFL